MLNKRLNKPLNKRLNKPLNKRQKNEQELTLARFLEMETSTLPIVGAVLFLLGGGGRAGLALDLAGTPKAVKTSTSSSIPMERC